jgi:hypothetical protein
MANIDTVDYRAEDGNRALRRQTPATVGGKKNREARREERVTAAVVIATRSRFNPSALLYEQSTSTDIIDMERSSLLETVSSSATRNNITNLMTTTVLVQSQLQAQIIALQSTMLKTYQLRDRFPLAEHIFQLRQTSRSVRVASITALVGLDHRMTSATDHSQDTPHVPGAFPKPHHVAGHMNTVSVRTQFTVEGKSRSRSRSRRPKPEDEDSSAVSTQLFCPYALDLQQHLYQPLADAYRKDGDGRCPYCRFGLHTRSGKAWEVVLDDMRQRNRTKAFLIGNRFVVKCHREGGGLACVLCRRFKNHDTVCREIADLVDHIWREHEVEELEDDEDINVV